MDQVIKNRGLAVGNGVCTAACSATCTAARFAACAALGLGVSAGAVAQSATSVTMYGVVDNGVEYISGVAAGGQSTSLTRMSSSNQLASRFGVRGTEDLGGGLKAIFQLESGISPDTGGLLQNGRLFGRTSNVGLDSKTWGTLTFGHQKNLIFDLDLLYDPMAYGTYGNTAVENTFFTERPDNSVKYAYAIGGLTTTLLYSMGRDSLAGTPAGSQAEVPGNSQIGRQAAISANYISGPLSIGFAYDQQNGATPALASFTDRHLYAGMTYQLADNTLYAGWMRRDDHVDVPNITNNIYWVGIMRPLFGNFGVKGSWVHTALKDSPNKSNLIAGSLYYDFSKSTEWYLNVAYANNSGTSIQGVTNTTPALPGQSQKGVVSGIMVRF